MKIVHIGKYYFPHAGGIESHIKTLLENDDKENEVIVSNTSSKNVSEEINGVKINRVRRLFEFNSLPICLGLAKEIKKTKADIFNIHMPNPMAVISYLVARPKAKLVLTWHSDIIRQRFLLSLYKPILKMIMRKADAIIATSENYAKSSEFLSLFKNKVHIIPLGINVDSFEKNGQTEDEVLKIENTYRYPIILFIGRQVYYKGIDVLLKAANGLPAEILVAGKGEKPKKYPHNVHFLGAVPDVKKYLYACDMLVLPSTKRSEAFGVVLLEAMACKKPVISTKLSTGTDYVNIDGKTGIVVKPGNVKELHDAMQKLLTEKKLANKMGENGFSRVKENFSISEVIKKHHQLYNNIYKHKKH